MPLMAIEMLSVCVLVVVPGNPLVSAPSSTAVVTPCGQKRGVQLVMLHRRFHQKRAVTQVWILFQLTLIKSIEEQQART